MRFQAIAAAMRCNFIAAALIAAGCSGPSEPTTSAPSQKSAPAPPPPAIAGLPVSMTVNQRSTTAVPGADNQVRLTIDDITRGQVIASLATTEGGPILSPVSMGVGDSATFHFKDNILVLKLAALDNALIGEDFATLAIAAADESTLTEEQKIETLLEHVARLDGATFLRNGERHSPNDAAGHLRTKWASIGEKGMSARAFIDLTATRSSLTGDPYEVVLPDGATRPAAEYLHGILRGIEHPKPEMPVASP